MKKLKIFTIIFALILSFTACQDKASAFDEQYDLGIKYLTDGNYEEAIIAFEAAIEIDSKNPNAYIKLADVYIEMGDEKKAREVLDRGLEYNPENKKIQNKFNSIGAETELNETTPAVTTTAGTVINPSVTEAPATEAATTTAPATAPQVTAALTSLETAKPATAMSDTTVEYENARIEVRNGKFWAYLNIPDMRDSYDFNTNAPGALEYCSFEIIFTDGKNVFEVSRTEGNYENKPKKLKPHEFGWSVHPVIEVTEGDYSYYSYDYSGEYINGIELGVSDNPLLWIFEIPDSYNFDISNLKIIDVKTNLCYESLFKKLIESDTSYRQIRPSEVTFFGSTLRGLSVPSAKTILEQNYGYVYQSNKGNYLSADDKTFDSEINFSLYDNYYIVSYDSTRINRNDATPSPLPIGIRNISTLDSAETVFRKLGFSNSIKIGSFIEEAAKIHFNSEEELEECMSANYWDLDNRDLRIEINSTKMDDGTFSLYSITLILGFDDNVGDAELTIGTRDYYGNFINQLISCDVCIHN